MKKKTKPKVKIKVETIYEPGHMRGPDISEYDTIEEAEMIVNGCLRWGIGIVSCKIIDSD